MKLTVGDYKKLEERLNNLEKNNKNLEESNKNLNEENIKLKEEQKNIKEKDIEDENLKQLYNNENNKSHIGNHRTIGQNYNSDENRCKTYFGATSVKELIEINTEEEKYRHVPKELKSLVVEVKKEFQNARMIAQIFYGDPLDRIGTHESQDKFSSCPNILNSYYGKNVLIPRLKAFGTTISGGGLEWIPTAVSSTYIPEIELERELIGALKQIPMPTSPYVLPTAGGFTKARRIAESTTMTGSNFTTGKITFTASKFGEYFELSEELNEDSIIPILELGRSELTAAHLRAFESCAINGVKIGTAHIDSDTQAGAADLAEKQFHGMRYLAIQNSANGGTYDYLNGSITDAKLRAHRKAMGKFGTNPLDLIWIVGPSAYLQMLGTDNVVTVDKVGPMATILKGQLGTYQGIPIMQSGFMREDLNASGVYDSITTDRTGLLLIHKNRWYWATRRPIRMALRESKSADDQYEIASYSRVDMQTHTQGASEIDVVYGINVPA